jgi:UDP-glucose 4-epimerase
MKRILITGKNSYIGNAFRDYMVQFPENQVDTISVRDGAWKEIDFSQYDSIFHVAGIVHLSMKNVSVKQKRLYYEVNTNLTIALAKKAKQEGVRQFIFMSSASVYGDGAAIGKQRIITKETLISPTNFYGDSKAKAEKGLKKLESEKFKVVILRPPMIYGKGCKGNYLALVKLAKKLPIFPKINNSRSMCYIGNLVEFVRLMIENEETGLFWPCNKELSNTSKLVRIIAAAYGKKVLLVPGCTWGVKLLGHVNKSVNKAFGNFTYEEKLGEYKKEYRKYGLEDSIRFMEG